MNHKENCYTQGIKLLFLMMYFLLLPSCGNNQKNIDVKVAFVSKEFQRNNRIEQEGKLGTTVMLIEGGGTKLCIISCDLISVQRDFADGICRKIETELNIPFSNILVSATHTHKGPSVNDSSFMETVKDTVFLAVKMANDELETAKKADMYFWLGQEASVGQNSRLLLSDSTIFWYGRREDAIRPTGTFDSDLPVIAFKSEGDKLEGVLFNHSTHNITFPSVVTKVHKGRNPGFYGLAAQELEKELGGKFLFLLGAAGSIHDLTLTTDEKVFRIKEAVGEALKKAERRDIPKLISVKKEIEYKIREYKEDEEEKAVSYYCRTRFGNLAPAWDPDPEATIAQFRNSRHDLAAHQGEVRKTWLQVMQIGEVAFVGIGGELFNDLGIDIKRRSPFRYTYIVSLANDQIGYIPDNKGFELGGYQVWSWWASYVAKGTGEAIVDEAIQLLSELYNSQ